MNIIFDTNAYRVLSYRLGSLSEKDRQVELRQFKKCESQKGITTKINFWVLCEILNHLSDIEDSGYIQCSETLKFMLKHSSSEGRAKFTSRFETHLAYKFNCSETIKHYKEEENDIAKLAIEFATNGRSIKFEKYIRDIPNFIEDYKRQRLNGFFETKSALKDAGVKNIPIDNEYLHYIVLRDMVRGILNIELECTVENNIKLEELNHTHYLGIARTIKVLANGYSPSNLNEDKFSRNFIDQIICYEIGKSNNTILITDDEGIIKTFIEKGYPENTMKLDKYLQSIGYSLPPPTVYE